MEVIDARASSTLSNFESSVYFSSWTLLSLESLPIFYKSGPIKVGNISSSLLTTESDKYYNSSSKNQSASWMGSSMLYKNPTDQGLVIKIGQIGYCTR